MASFCAACGNSLAAEDRFCRVCGRDSAAASAVPPAVAYPGSVAPAVTSGKAIASLVCGLFFFMLPVSIVAIIFGHISLSEIRKSAGRLKGEGLAIAGLILGYSGLAVVPILIIAAIAIPNVLRARNAANESSAVAGVRTLIVAETTYAETHPDAGFTCSLSALADGQPMLGQLADGKKSGYAFELMNCSPDVGAVNVRFQVVAYPLVAGQTGRRAFCADESAVIKASEGSAQDCLEKGVPLN